LSPELEAWRVEQQRPFLQDLIGALVNRVQKAAQAEQSAEYARLQLLNRLDVWEARRSDLAAGQLLLAYERAKDQTRYRPLIKSAEEASASDTPDAKTQFVIANSMREVQPEVNLLVSPDPDRLFFKPPPGAPAWEAQPGPGGDQA